MRRGWREDLKGDVGAKGDFDFTWRFFRCEGVINYGILSAFIFHYFSLTFEV